MRKQLLGILTSLAIACSQGDAALASDNKAMDADIHKIELQWENIKFNEHGSPNQVDHMDVLARSTEKLVEKYPDSVEPLIWYGIVMSEEAGMVGPLRALSYAKKARDILEAAYRKNPAALSAGAPTSLGVLYYRVPGWPIGFGNDKEARKLLKHAMSLAPNGMDTNYFYADFLMTQREYGKAYKVLKHALSLPQQKDRPLWDKYRRIVIRELMAKAKTARMQTN